MQNLFKYILISTTLIFAIFGKLFSGDATTSTYLDTSKVENYNIHFQQTFVNQYHPAFFAKYSGKNSLSKEEENCLSFTSTLFCGLKLFDNAELYFNPEVAGGAGFSKVQGVAGFPNNEVVRVGKIEPTFYIARLFLQYTINLENELKQLNDDVNQISSKISDNRLVVRIGKFCILDYFDDNLYSHDGRSQFMNWALVSNGSWDYTADTRGYTNSIMAEYNKKGFAFRIAFAMVPNEANGPIDLFNSDFMKQNNLSKNFGITFELEKQYKLFDKDGITKLLLYRNSAHSANYELAISSNAFSVDSISKIRHNGNVKYGFGLNIQQELSDYVGTFLRLGWNNGQTETWMFTEIDRTLSLGILVKGNYWNRVNDEFGFAICFNGLSKEHREFLKLGGYGFIIGDGNLNYGIEQNLETFYKLNITKNIQVSLAYQYVINPAYNIDRGPVSIYSLRTHIEL